MASVSGTNSLGNTALRGFGGLASGIDRDAIIEQMSLATTTKINNQKGAMTSLNWRQEAFRSISDKILNLHDNFFSFASTTSLRSVSLFAKSQVTAMGDPTTSKYITATGSSNMIDHMSILAAKQATAARAISKKHGSGEITTGIDSDMLTDTDKFRTSNLSGKTITFASHSDSGYQNSVTLTLPDSFKDKDGNTVKIDYVEDSVDDIVKKLNEYLDSSENLKFGTQKLSENIQFTNEGGKIGLKATSVGEGNGILIRGEVLLL